MAKWIGRATATRFGQFINQHLVVIAVVIGTLGLVLGSYAVKQTYDQSNQAVADRIAVDIKTCDSGNMTRQQLRQFFKRLIVAIPASEMSTPQKIDFFNRIDDGLPARDCSQASNPDPNQPVPTIPTDDGITPTGG